MSRLTALLASLGGALLALPAFADETAICADRAVVAQRLAKDFSENPVAMGITSSGNVIEVFSARTGDTWTIVMTLPNGKSCLMATGEGWEQVAPKAGPGLGA